MAINTKTLVGDVIGEGASQIGEGIFGGVLRGIAAAGGLRRMSGIDPGDGGGDHTELQMIDHRIGVAGLGIGAADLLLDLAEAGLDTLSLILL